MNTTDIRKTKQAIEFKTITDKDTIISFLSNLTPDYKGRTIQNMIELSDEELEECHDQIQWMFPLHEKSDYAFTYPVLTKEIMTEVNRNLKVSYWMRMSLDRMKRFYGLTPCVEEDRVRDWGQLFNIDNLAQSFYEECREALETNVIGDFSLTYKYWEKALNEDIWESLKQKVIKNKSINIFKFFNSRDEKCFKKQLKDEKFLLILIH